MEPFNTGLQKANVDGGNENKNEHELLLQSSNKLWSEGRDEFDVYGFYDEFSGRHM